jgi:hypothetical protein
MNYRPAEYRMPQRKRRRSSGLGPSGKAEVVVAIAERPEGYRAKVTDWLRRYGLAECVGLTCALVASFVVRRLSRSDIAAAYGAAWGESIGYSSVIILRDYLAAMRAAHSAGRSVNVRDAGGVATGLLTEFGPSAVLDTLVIRPLAMGVGMRLVGPQRGVIAGKIGADILFYIPVIFIYERRKRKERKRNG